MDFGLLPPEINSGRMYTGPGAGPMLAAATAWSGLADQMHSAAAAYESVLADLTAQWRGPSAARMFSALEPYRAWTAATAGQAEAAATQAMAAVAAYEDAFCATVPPPVITANRAQLAALVATNIFGQNTPAIMATELHYAEMWAQDAVAMYGYAGRAASTLPSRPFTPPPDVTQPAASPADPSSLLSGLDAFLTGPFSPLELYKLPAVAQLLAGQCYLLPRAMGNLLGALGKTAAPAAGGELLTRILTAPGPVGAGAMSASVGRAELVGALSVPKTWASPTPAAIPAIGTAAGTLPRGGPTALTAVVAADGQESLLANLAASSMAGQTPSRARGGGVPVAGLGSLAGGDDTEPDVPAVSNIFIIPEDESPDCAAEAVR